MRLIDADKIIFHEIDEIGGEYEPYLGCSKSQIDNLPPVEAIPKADYEARLKAEKIAMIEELKTEIDELPTNRVAITDSSGLICYGYSGCRPTAKDASKVIQQKINSLKDDKR